MTANALVPVQGDQSVAQGIPNAMTTGQDLPPAAIGQIQAQLTEGQKWAASLLGRMRQIEVSKNEWQEKYNDAQQGNEDQIYRERVKREQLSKELDAAKLENQQLGAHRDLLQQQIAQLERLRAQEVELTEAERQEKRALAGQVESLREQIRNIDEQNRTFNQEITNLRTQITQLVQQNNDYQRQVVQSNQRIERLFEEQRRQPPAEPSWGGRLLELVRPGLGLLFPEMGNPSLAKYIIREK